MNLQTKIPLNKQAENQIDYHANILLLGSCFSNNIGEKFDGFNFNNLQNPFGILFHPKAIETLLTHTINEKQYAQDDLFFLNEQWHCFDAHSKLSDISKQVVVNTLQNQLNVTYKQLKKATHIIITLGTAWVYRFLKTNSIVANCHKVPQKQFKKELLSVNTLTVCLENILALIQGINPKVSIIFTLSPVRHLKDGFVENMQSKAHLLTAIHQVNKTPVYYFPSYEIMMDELRDYRFYSEDMIHPNTTAVNYIWTRFKTVWVAENTYKIMDEVEHIKKGLAHKPRNKTSKAYQNTLLKLEAQKKRLQSQHPYIKW